jgi:hypothetical protein
MKFNLINLAFFLLLISISVTAQNYPAKITDEKGVKIVGNPNYPKEGVYDLVLEELFTIGLEKDNSKYFLSNVIDVKLDNQGNFYLFDMQCKIIVFDKQGKYLRQFGQKGKGPGDFEQYTYFAVSSDNKIILNDSDNNRFCFLDLNGKYLNGANYNGRFSQLQLDSKDNLYVNSADNGKQVVSEKMHYVPITEKISKYSKKSNSFSIIGSFPGSQMLMASKGTQFVMSGIKNEFIWKISPKDILLTGFADSYLFSIYSLDGKLIKKFGRKYSPAANKEYKEGSNDSPYLPAFTRNSQYDSEGNFWSNLDKGEKPDFYIYDIFSDDGIFQKQVYSKQKIKLLKGNLAFVKTSTEKEPLLIKFYKYSLKKKN